MELRVRFENYFFLTLVGHFHRLALILAGLSEPVHLSLKLSDFGLEKLVVDLLSGPRISCGLAVFGEFLLNGIQIGIA